MLIVVQIAEACLEPCQTSNMNLVAKVINGYRANPKPFQTLEMELFCKLLLATEANSES